MVDVAVAGERGDGGGDEAPKIECFHSHFLRWLGVALSSSAEGLGGLHRGHSREEEPIGAATYARRQMMGISAITIEAYLEAVMDYSAWKLFMDAAEFGSLSKVAVAYGTSQPHISRQINELEQECGGRLFQRTGRGVRTD